MLALLSVGDWCFSLGISANRGFEEQIRENPSVHTNSSVAPHWFCERPCGDAVKNHNNTGHSVQMFLTQHQKPNCLKANSELPCFVPGWRETFRMSVSFYRVVTFSQSIRECRQLNRVLWINVKRQQGSTLSCPRRSKAFPLRKFSSLQI